MGISEGISPEDVVTTGSREAGPTNLADADRFGKCFVAHFELELEDPRGKKSSSAGRDRWSALRTLHASLVDAGAPGKIPGTVGRGALVVRGAGDPGAFPPPAPPPLARIIDDDDDVRWAAVKEMAEPPENPDAPPGLSRDASARDDARGGVAPWEYRPLRALLGKPPASKLSEYEIHSVPWGAHRERAPNEPRYVAPSLDDAMDKLVRVTDAHARRLAVDADAASKHAAESESRARELERTLRRAAADDDFFSRGAAEADGYDGRNGRNGRGRRSLAELDADAAAAARDLRAFDAGAGARKAARENVMRGFIERESLEGTDPRVVAPGTLPTAARRAPLWDMGDLSNVDAAYDLEYVNPRQMRRAGGGTTKAKAENESDENDEYVNPRLSRLGSSARSVA